MKRFLSRIMYLIFIRPWLVYIIGVRFENREVLNSNEQYIIVANHNSHFDTVAITAALPGHMMRKTRAVAASEYFAKNPLTRALMSFFFNAVLIKRHREENEPSIVDTLDQELKKGYSLILFPEGTRGKAGVIADFKKGIAILLKRNPHIPFIPVYLDGFGRVLPKGHSLIIPLVCKVRFGKPLFPHSKEIEEVLEEVKEAIIHLRKEDERDHNKFEFE